MTRFSANLSFLYPELPFAERFAAAARDGFTGVEYLSPYELPAEAVRRLLRDNGLSQVLFNLPSGNWAKGERGIACLPDRIEEFRAGVETARRYADALGCAQVNAVAGIAPPGIAPAILEETLIGNLRYAAETLGRIGIRVLLEPINLRDIPGFFVSRTEHAERLLDRAASPHLFMQFDFYHVQVMQGDLIATFERLQGRIAHVQIADAPGRNEPGTGEINYRTVLQALERLGYGGWVGCEYRPKSGIGAAVEWMKALR